MNTDTRQTKKPKVFNKLKNLAEAMLESGGTRVSPIKKVENNSAQTELEWAKSRAKKERHQEVINTPVFNRKDEDVKDEIIQLENELETYVGRLNDDVKIKAIQQKTVNHGIQDLSFTQKLKRDVVRFFTLDTSDSGSLLDISMQRMASKDKYGMAVKQSNTHIMMSHESAASRSGA